MANTTKERHDDKEARQTQHPGTARADLSSKVGKAPGGGAGTTAEGSARGGKDISEEAGERGFSGGVADANAAKAGGSKEGGKVEVRGIAGGDTSTDYGE
ncbi:MAG TPA: hypothetical protein VNO70_12965 [Blastocatellia bacterium]|nr:hypothetical protein [Blastocatellia bacterium]